MTMPLTELNKLIEGGKLTESQTYMQELAEGIDEEGLDRDDNARHYFLSAKSMSALPNALRVIAECKVMAEYYAGWQTIPSEGPWGVNSTDFGRTAQAALALIAAFERDVLQQEKM